MFFQLGASPGCSLAKFKHYPPLVGPLSWREETTHREKGNNNNMIFLFGIVRQNGCLNKKRVLLPFPSVANKGRAQRNPKWSCFLALVFVADRLFSQSNKIAMRAQIPFSIANLKFKKKKLLLSLNAVQYTLMGRMFFFWIRRTKLTLDCQLVRLNRHCRPWGYKYCQHSYGDFSLLPIIIPFDL